MVKGCVVSIKQSNACISTLWVLLQEHLNYQVVTYTANYVLTQQTVDGGLVSNFNGGDPEVLPATE